MNFSEKMKRMAIDNGKLFKPQIGQPVLNLPVARCGYNMTIIPVERLKCVPEVDISAAVSLALLNQQSLILDSYANKLPIMAINVSRLLYTIEAFKLQNKNTDERSPIIQAVEFYVRTDLAQRIGGTLPNIQFSEFLHRLKSSGYEDYIFALAKETDMNVDYIIDARVAARYIKRSGSAQRSYNTAIGTLTVINEPNNEWYVKTTKSPILQPV